MGRRTVLVAAMAVVALSVGMPGARAAGPSCAVDRTDGRSTQAPTLSQTFSTDVEVSVWEIRLRFVDAFTGDITSRVMFSPDLPLDPGVTLDGLEAASAVTPVAAAAGDRLWVRFTAEAPASAPVPLPGTMALAMDFDYPGGPIEWAECGAPYDDGQMHTSETFVTAGVGLGGLPTVAKLESTDVDLAFRIL